MKRQLEELRLKTKMSEAFTASRTPYPRQAEQAKQQLSSLQEAYKAMTGEYAKEYMIVESSSNELENIQNIDEKLKPARDKDSKDAVWRCVEIVRKDGAVAKIGGKYKDGNGDTYTIDDMYIADNGAVIALAAEGGFINLQNVEILK